MASLRPKRWAAYAISDSAPGHNDASNVGYFATHVSVPVATFTLGETLLRTIPFFQFTLGMYGATVSDITGEIVSDTNIDVALWFDPESPGVEGPPNPPGLYNEEIVNDDPRWIWRTQLIRSGLTQTEATQGVIVSATHTVPQDSLQQTFSRRGPTLLNDCAMWAWWWINTGDHGEDYWTNGLATGVFGWLSGRLYVRTLIEGPAGAG